MGTGGSPSQSPAARGIGAGPGGRAQPRTEAAGRGLGRGRVAAPGREGPGPPGASRRQTGPRPCARRVPGCARGERARRLKPLPPPSFETGSNLALDPAPPLRPGNSEAAVPAKRRERAVPPSGRFPPPRPTASRPRPGLRAPETPGPQPLPHRLPERRRARSERTKRRRSSSTRRPRPSAPPARTRRPPGRAASRGRLCVGLARRLRARRAL